MDFSNLMYLYGNHGLSGLKQISETKIERETKPIIEEKEEEEQEPETKGSGIKNKISFYEAMNANNRGRFVDKTYLHERKQPMTDIDHESEMQNAIEKKNATIIDNRHGTLIHGLGFDFKKKKMSKSDLKKSFGNNNIEHLNEIMTGGSMLMLPNTKKTEFENIRLIV